MLKLRVRYEWLLVVMTGCLPVEDSRTYFTTQEFSLDAVKLVAQGNDKNDDPSCFLQDRYTIGPNRRLLLRFETLKEHVNDVFVSEGKDMLLQMRLVDPDARREDLRLCPLSKSWMMLATWEYYHPFGGGKWDRAGGDYEDAGCLVPMTAAEGSTPSDPSRVNFKITRWFVDYARGRDQNFGFVLMTNATTEIVGEKSGAYSPRITFEKVVTVTPSRPATPTAR